MTISDQWMSALSLLEPFCYSLKDFGPKSFTSRQKLYRQAGLTKGSPLMVENCPKIQRNRIHDRVKHIKTNNSEINRHCDKHKGQLKLLKTQRPNQVKREQLAGQTE